MKKRILITLLAVICYSQYLFANDHASMPPSCCQHLEVKMELIEQRLSDLETQQEETSELTQIRFGHLTQQFAKLEKKFDTYFLWGYGTLITLILAMLANGWLGRRKVSSI